MCAERRCLSPKPCPNLIVDHSKYLESLRALRKGEGRKEGVCALGRAVRLCSARPGMTRL